MISPHLQVIPRESLAVWGFSFLILAILRHRLVVFLHKTKAINRTGKALFSSPLSLTTSRGVPPMPLRHSRRPASASPTCTPSCSTARESSSSAPTMPSRPVRPFWTMSWSSSLKMPLQHGHNNWKFGPPQHSLHGGAWGGLFMKHEILATKAW